MALSDRPRPTVLPALPAVAGIVRALLLAFALAWVALPARAGGRDSPWDRWREIGFEQLTVAGGLPHATTTSFAQAGDGALWIGTFGGLVRYDGYRTQVSFEPVALEDGGTQNFVVATITRFFSSSMGPDQVKELGRQIARKYAGFGTYPSSDKPGVRWLPFASDGPTLKLFAPIGDVFRRGMALRHHPACQ